MWRVVLDPVVLTSALLNPHGPPARLLDFAMQGRLRLFATTRMMAVESRLLRSDSLRERHGMTDREVSRFMADLPVLLCLVPAPSRPAAWRDIESEVLACAALSHADFIVTSSSIHASTTELGSTQMVTADQLVKLAGRGIL